MSHDSGPSGLPTPGLGDSGARIGVLAPPAAATLLGVRQQLLLAFYWFSLSFHGGALPGVAVPAQLVSLTSDATKTTMLALLTGFSSLVIMVVQPAAGMLSDLSTHRWGRRRPYVLGGALLDVAGLIIMGRATSLPLLFAGLMLASFGNGISSAAYQAYIPDHVPPRQFGEASGYLGAMTMIGTIGSFAVAGFVVAPGSASVFYAITIVIVLAGAAVTIVAIPDPPMTQQARPLIGSWRALWLDPWRHPDFSWVFATRSMMMIALYTLFTFVAYYVRDVLHITQFVQGTSVVAGVAIVAAIGGGVLSGWLSDRWGRKWLVSTAGELMALALLLLAVVHQLNLVVILGLLFGLAYGCYSAVDWALAVDVLPVAGFAAKDLGLWGIATSLPQTLAPFAGGAILGIFAPWGATGSYGALFLLAGGCAALSGVFIWKVRTAL